MKILKFVMTLSLLCAFPVYAEEVVVNEDTGANSSNELNIVIERSVNIKNNNDAGVLNEIEMEVKTGGNDSSENTGDSNLKTPDAGLGLGGGSISTGVASFIVKIENELNNNKTEIQNSCCDEEGVLPDVPEGKGGGVEPTPVENGVGGGSEAELIPSTGTLPSAGSDPFNFLSSVLGIPLLLLALIRIAELKSHKTFA
jgi:hypothetical protein